VGRILTALEAAHVPYLVVLTADHGGYDAPERHQERGIPEAGRLDSKFDLAVIGKELAAEFKLGIDGTRLLEGAPQGDVYLSTAVPPVLRSQVLAAAKAKMLAFPQVQTVITADEIANTNSPSSPVDDWTLFEKAKASFDRTRSGDLLVFLRPRVIPPGHVATHGSPWNYDRRVPILFMYPGMIPHEQPLSVETIDILPTVAALIDLKIPDGEIDGRCLDLDPGASSTCK